MAQTRPSLSEPTSRSTSSQCGAILNVRSGPFSEGTSSKIRVSILKRNWRDKVLCV
jgi:hypothetical protein